MNNVKSNYPEGWQLSNYPEGWQLTDREFEYFRDEIRKGMGTTNGDTAPIEVTVRQLSLLIQNYRIK